MKFNIKDRDELKAVYKRNKTLTNPTKTQSQRRGYELESILEFLIAPFEIHASYKAEGEQIDGSFFMWGQTFLLEAKWLKEQTPASYLYAFKGKVDGKFHTTSGVYLSMNGYSKDSVSALRYGKSINVLLFNDDDLDFIIEKDVPFETVLKFKLRQAGDLGVPNAPYRLTSAAACLAVQSPVFSGTTVNLTASPIASIDRGAYLVFYPSSFASYQIQGFFSDLPTQEIEPFKFYRIEDGENPLDTIAVVTNINATDPDAPEISGLIVLIDEKQKNNEQAVQLRLNLPEVIQQSNHDVPLGIFTMQQAYLETGFEQEDLEKNAPLRQILQFLEDGMQTSHFFFDDNAIYPAIKELLDNAEWDFQQKTVTLYDAYDENPSKFIDYESLVGYLEEVAKAAAGEETPNEILKDEGYPDYDEEVQNILNQYPQIKQLGWL